MKVVILAGGVGTRLAEETDIKPKPMVEIGGKPILWHIMMHYACYGFNEFVIALGYKGEYIKKYIVDYCSLEQQSHGQSRQRQGRGP
jgi:glucose-1-phosphate cytidylyltransferase